MYSRSTPRSTYNLFTEKREFHIRQNCPKDSVQLVQTNVKILVSLGDHLRTHLKEHTEYDQATGIHGKPRRVSVLFGEAQLTGCLKVLGSGPLEWDAGI